MDGGGAFYASEKSPLLLRMSMLFIFIYFLFFKFNYLVFYFFILFYRAKMYVWIKPYYPNVATWFADFSYIALKSLLFLKKFF